MKLICQTCCTIFDTIDDTMTDQAYGCAATVNRDGTITGYYGSEIADCTTFVIKNRPSFLKNGIICDECLRKFIDQNVLVEMIEYKDKATRAVEAIISNLSDRSGMDVFSSLDPDTQQEIIESLEDILRNIYGSQ